MSPECLLTGQQSNAGDVYSFGITLYELYTATQAFRCIPASLLGHKIAQDHLRPVFPPDTPIGYKQLAEACWDPISLKRPDFSSIVSTLIQLREEVGGETLPIDMTRARADNNQEGGGQSIHMSQLPSGMIMVVPMDESSVMQSSLYR